MRLPSPHTRQTPLQPHAKRLGVMKSVRLAGAGRGLPLWRDPILDSVAQMLQQCVALRRAAKSGELVEFECRIGLISHSWNYQLGKRATVRRLQLGVMSPTFLRSGNHQFNSGTGASVLPLLSRNLRKIAFVPPATRSLYVILSDGTRMEYAVELSAPPEGAGAECGADQDEQRNLALKATFVNAIRKETCSKSDLYCPQCSYDFRFATAKEVDITPFAMSQACPDPKTGLWTGLLEPHQMRFHTKKTIHVSRYVNVRLSLVRENFSVEMLRNVLQPQLTVPPLGSLKQYGSVELEVDVDLLLRECRRTRTCDAVVETAAAELLSLLKFITSSFPKDSPEKPP